MAAEGFFSFSFKYYLEIRNGETSKVFVIN